MEVNKEMTLLSADKEIMSTMFKKLDGMYVSVFYTAIRGMIGACTNTPEQALFHMGTDNTKCW